MSHRDYFKFATLLVILCATQGQADPIVINELMAANQGSVLNPQGQSADWIELYNPTGVPVNVAGMFLTDDLADPTQWQIPRDNPSITTLAPGAYLVIWADNNTNGAGLHASFSLDRGGDQVFLIHADGSTVIDQVVFGKQQRDVTYGRFPDGDMAWRPLATATPGAANVKVFAGFVADTRFSHDRGFYDSPFDLVIRTETEEVLIIYTLDGSVPSTANGQVYTAPIPVAGTTCVRALAFKFGWRPSNVDTHTYVFPAQVMRQNQADALRAGYPASWDGYPGDYEMDPEIVDDPAYAGDMQAALTALPVVSIVTAQRNLFDPARGVYMNTTRKGPDWERPASVEFFRQDKTEAFQVDCGIRLQGGAARQPRKCPKHSFSLRFRGIYGPAKLAFPLFPESPVTEFNSLHLRGMFNNAWTHWNAGQRQRAQLIRDQWVRDALLDMGERSAGRGRYVHLYLNGLYWGVYDLHERPDGSHYAAYYCPEDTQIDAFNGTTLKDGTRTAWNEMKQFVQRRDWASIQAVLAVDTYIDWYLIQHFGHNDDLKDGQNWRSAGGGPQRMPWRLYSWDSERVLENVNSTGRLAKSQDPPGIFAYLEDIGAFRTRFADRLHRHFFNNGALTPERNTQRWNARAQELDLAIVAESARWGDYRRDMHSWSSGPYELYTKNNFWLPEQQRLINEYFPRRTANMLSKYRNEGLYPALDAPVFYIDGNYQHGGATRPEAAFSLEADTGAIWYTLDGTDPRIPGIDPQPDQQRVLVAENAPKQVIVPATELPAAWQGGQPYDDSTWTSGTGGVGYERSSGYDALFNIDLEAQMYGQQSSCYIRIPFSLAPSDIQGLDQLVLRIRYDDGFVAYLNGIEVARANAPGTLNFQSQAPATHSDSEAVNLKDFNISQHVDQLRRGKNVLALHGLNRSPTSSDLLISVELEAARVLAGHDPGVSASALRYEGPILLSEDTHVKSRALSGGTWSALNEAVFTVNPTIGPIAMSEIMYHDADPSALEYIELLNVSADPVVLYDSITGEPWRFSDASDSGIDLSFPTDPPLALAPGERMLLVKRLADLNAQFVLAPQVQVLEWGTGRLGNGSEHIQLSRPADWDLDGTLAWIPVDEVSYSDGVHPDDFAEGHDPWPTGADGQGLSLHRMDLHGDGNDPLNWEAATPSPGE